MEPLARLKQQLGIRRLVLQIHDASFPSRPDEDTGRGSPYSHGARDFLQFVRKLGFDGIQLGPQGQTDRDNPCPYDGRLFVHDFLSIALRPLVNDPYWESLLAEDTIRRITEARPSGTQSTHHEFAWDKLSAALDEVWLAFKKARVEKNSPLDRDLAVFRTENANWLDLASKHLDPARHSFVQFVLHKQHHQLKSEFPDLHFYGDLQIGMGPVDAKMFADLFHPDYAMGAPPSRTNPKGQPWGYAVFHPDKIDSGAAQEFLRTRVRRMLDGLDGLRIDHPHGLICPWVYRRNTLDSGEAVRAGARLYESPNLADHPELAAFAIARPEQIDESKPRYAGERTTALDDTQAEKYSRLFDVVIDVVRELGGDPESNLACEVLSTLPYPLGQVMQRHSLGRFRVIQKAKLDDPADVYRIEQAEPADWIMMGNHDTPPIWLLAQGWCNGSRGADWGEYLADCLWIPAAERPDFVRRIASDPGELTHSLFAAMLASQAAHVAMFFPDLLGLTGLYNTPGVVNDTNWRLRVPSNFQRHYQSRRKERTVLDVPSCLEAALRARARQEAASPPPN